MGQVCSKGCVTQVMQSETLEWTVDVLWRLYKDSDTEEYLARQLTKHAKDLLEFPTTAFWADIPLTEGLVRGLVATVSGAVLGAAAADTDARYDAVTSASWGDVLTDTNKAAPAAMRDVHTHDDLMAWAFAILQAQFQADTVQYMRTFAARMPRAPGFRPGVDAKTDAAMRTRIQAYAEAIFAAVLEVFQNYSVSRKTVRAVSGVVALLLLDALSPLRATPGADNDVTLHDVVGEFEGWLGFVAPLIQMLANVHTDPRKWIVSKACCASRQ